MTLDDFIETLENYEDISPFKYKELILLLYELKSYREKMKSNELVVNVPYESAISKRRIDYTGERIQAIKETENESNSNNSNNMSDVGDDKLD